MIRRDDADSSNRMIYLWPHTLIGTPLATSKPLPVFPAGVALYKYHHPSASYHHIILPLWLTCSSTLPIKMPHFSRWRAELDCSLAVNILPTCLEDKEMAAAGRACWWHQLTACRAIINLAERKTCLLFLASVYASLIPPKQSTA